MKVGLYLDIGRVLALGEFVKSDSDRESEAKLAEGLHKAAQDFNGIGYSHELPSMDKPDYSHSGQNTVRRADFKSVDTKMLRMKRVPLRVWVSGRR